MNINTKLEKYVIKKSNKIKISSLEINKGDIFLALKGKNYHGNKFINSALKKGAKYCITDNKKFIRNEKVLLVENIFDYLIKLAVKKRSLYENRVIGITGSAGKTTLKETLVFFLKKYHKISFSQKSYNNELGVLVSILNLNLKSKYAIFEIGTNNFGEIKYLTKIIKPTDIFITNIQSTHLENFKTRNNISKEKSDIFLLKYNNQRRNIYLNITNQYEKKILRKANNEKKLKVIKIGNSSNKYFIKSIQTKGKNYEVIFSINKKIKKINSKSNTIFRLNNLLFCYAFFSENNISNKIISDKYKFLKPVDGRGLTHHIFIKKKRIIMIDESYNANPDTMLQSIEYFDSIKKDSSKKILILGNMNELGVNTDKLHFKLIKNIDKFNFKFVILCGEFLRRSIKKSIKQKNEFIYLDSKNEIMRFLYKNIHNDDIIMVKCSNNTEVNNFAVNLLKKKVKSFD